MTQSCRPVWASMLLSWPSGPRTGPTTWRISRSISFLRKHRLSPSTWPQLIRRASRYETYPSSRAAIRWLGLSVRASLIFRTSIDGRAAAGTSGAATCCTCSGSSQTARTKSPTGKSAPEAQEHAPSSSGSGGTTPSVPWRRWIAGRWRKSPRKSEWLSVRSNATTWKR